MKIKLYTKSYDEALLKEIDNNGRQFTAEEHNYASEKEVGEHFKTKDKLIIRFLLSGYNKLPALDFLIKYINNNGYKNILSLGAGECVLEYLLKTALPKDSKVVATDFDHFFIKKVKAFFPSIISEEFDFFRDDLKDLQKKIKIHPDVAVFFGSTYVMNDSNFINLLRGLKEIGVKRIIDFHGGYLSFKNTPLILLSRFIHNICGKHKGKFHGYGRTRGEIRKLYKKAGLHLIQEARAGPYKYIAVCE